jgi:peptidoglycan-associated lipoprotein
MSVEEMQEYRLQEQKGQKRTQAEQAAEEEVKEKAIENLRERIHFAFDSYELRVEARQTLKAKAEIMDRYPGIDLIIEGHCDERGTDEYNLALGERRARAAYEFMVLLGVDPQRLSIISYGEERPLDPQNNEEAWAKNRRCEFRVAQ